MTQARCASATCRKALPGRFDPCTADLRRTVGDAVFDLLAQTPRTTPRHCGLIPG